MKAQAAPSPVVASHGCAVRDEMFADFKRKLALYRAAISSESNVSEPFDDCMAARVAVQRHDAQHGCFVEKPSTQI